MSPFTLACLQVTSSNIMAENVETIGAMIAEAAARGAAFVALPETANIVEPRREALFAQLRTEDEDPALAAWSGLAREKGVWLLIGSLMIRLSDEQAANRSFLIDDQGRIRARYDKLHMFDVDLGEGERYRESATYRPGEKAVLAETPWGKLGMSICYDLRFPALYRSLAKAGAEMFSVPAAFTVPTGEAHWATLLKARAIENGAFLFAPAQTGTHPSGRRTWGHSMIVGPWGEVLGDAGSAPGILLAEIDMAKVGEVRRNLPSLSHDRAFTLEIGQNS